MKILSYNLLAAGLLIWGWVFAQQTQDHSEHKYEHHHHGTIEASAFQAIPDIQLKVMRDSAAGWNLHLITENFTFTPEKIDQETNTGEGHAHVYVDGNKAGRIYGPWYHLSGLTAGTHTIRISLNGNDHSEFVLNGEPIEAIAEVIEE